MGQLKSSRTHHQGLGILTLEEMKINQGQFYTIMKPYQKSKILHTDCNIARTQNHPIQVIGNRFHINKKGLLFHTKYKHKIHHELQR